MPMIRKLGEMVALREELQPIKLHNPLITWSWDTLQIKTIISPLSKCLWLPNLAGW